MKKVLLIEDDQLLAKTLIELLTNRYAVTHESTVAKAYDQLEDKSFDLVILDRVLDGRDSLEIVEYILDFQPDTKIICVSQLNQLDKRLEGLYKGADDYLTKPLSYKELTLKMEKLLLFQRCLKDGSVKIDNITYNKHNALVVSEGEQIYLRNKENLLLQHLLRYRNQIVSRESLIDAIWSDTDLSSYSTLDVSINRLRLKLKKNSHMIQTIRGSGYVLRCTTVA